MSDQTDTRITIRPSAADRENLIDAPAKKAGISASAQILRALWFAGEFMPDDFALDEDMYVKGGKRQFKRGAP